MKVLETLCSSIHLTFETFFIVLVQWPMSCDRSFPLNQLIHVLQQFAHIKLKLKPIYINQILHTFIVSCLDGKYFEFEWHFITDFHNLFLQSSQMLQTFCILDTTQFAFKS